MCLLLVKRHGLELRVIKTECKCNIFRYDVCGSNDSCFVKIVLLAFVQLSDVKGLAFVEIRN